MKKLVRTLQTPAYRLVIETARQNWGLLVINLITNFIGAVLEGSTLGLIYLAVAYLTPAATEQAAGSDSQTQILQTISTRLSLSPERMFLLLIFSAVLLQGLLSLSNYCNKVTIAYFSAKVQPYVTGKVFERILTFSYSCVSRYKVGDLVMFSNSAAGAVDRQITTANNFLVSLSFALIYLVVIIKLSPVLAIAATVLSIIVGAIQYRLVPRLRKVVKRVNDTQVESSKYITESIQGLRLIHTYGMQQDTLSSARSLLDKTREQLQRRAFLFYLPEPILDVIPMIALAFLAASAILFQGSSSNFLPLLLTFLLALQRLSVRLKSLAGTVTTLTDNSARMLRLEEILGSHDKEFERSGSTPFTGLENDIELKDVSLSYTNDDNFALESLSLRIPRDRITALVGESGAGKSSIVDLIMGLYQPTSGRVAVGKYSLDHYDLREWRQHVGIVSQDTFVFNNSILENIRYGCADASFEDAVAAAKAAQAHHFITRLPAGYDTVVGERGYSLSGGQRQRLALARALIRQPSILILDEATSALDSESEKLIQEALEQFQKNRTVIVVAHRLSTIADADNIVVLERGQIVETGSHHYLMEKGERYARYWNLQSSVAVSSPS